MRKKDKIRSILFVTVKDITIFAAENPHVLCLADAI